MNFKKTQKKLLMKNKLIYSQLLLVVIILCLGAGCTKKSSSKTDEIMNADQGFQFPPGFPPDPAEAGKKTLEGIDSDHDGLRDDLQRWIYARFPSDSKKRASLRQMATSYQNDLFLKHDREIMVTAFKRLSKAIDCLEDTFGDENSEMEFIRAKVLNTKERTKRFLEINQWYDGMTLGPSKPSDGAPCES
jgi:hypothetical protein